MKAIDSRRRELLVMLCRDLGAPAQLTDAAAVEVVRTTSSLGRPPTALARPRAALILRDRARRAVAEVRAWAG